MEKTKKVFRLTFKFGGFDLLDFLPPRPFIFPDILGALKKGKTFSTFYREKTGN